jgi:ribosomal protein S27E
MLAEPESVDVRSAFHPIATSYRKRKRVASFVIVPVILFLIFAMFVLHSTTYAIIGVVCFAVLAVVADIFTPKLICPSCLKKADSRLEQFCPECGHATIIDAGRSWSWPRCGTCGKQLVFSRGRPFYSIRFCTHCAAHLDDEGV